jgi:hypothetical protein
VYEYHVLCVEVYGELNSAMYSTRVQEFNDDITRFIYFVIIGATKCLHNSKKNKISRCPVIRLNIGMKKREEMAIKLFSGHMLPRRKEC